MMPGNDSAVGPPFFWTTANQNSPLPVSRFSAWSSEARPAPFRKPCTAWSGAPTRGPRFSSLTSARVVGRPSTTSVSRRGVAKARASVEREPGRLQPVADQALEIVRRARLHARGNFFAEQFEKKLGHLAAPSATLRAGFAVCVASQASQQALARSRTRPM